MNNVPVGRLPSFDALTRVTRHDAEALLKPDNYILRLGADNKPRLSILDAYGRPVHIAITQPHRTTVRLAEARFNDTATIGVAAMRGTQVTIEEFFRQLSHSHRII